MNLEQKVTELERRVEELEKAAAATATISIEKLTLAQIKEACELGRQAFLEVLRESESRQRCFE
jgi:hypothetical protein